MLLVARIKRDDTHRRAAILFAVLIVASTLQGQISKAQAKVPEWLQTALGFLIDAYYPPMAPEMKFDAEALAETMKAMNVNTVRMAAKPCIWNWSDVHE
jgi:hypothetical protein